MSLDLVKGQNVPIVSAASATAVGGLSKISAGLNWKPNEDPDPKKAFDLDAFAFLLKGGKGTAADTVYFKNLTHASGAVVHSGDNKTGGASGDEETITIDLAKLTALGFDEVALAVDIHDAAIRKQVFGMTPTGIHIYETDTKKELGKFDISEDHSVDTCINIASIYLKDGVWKFKAVEKGEPGGISAVATKYGI